MKTLSSIIFLTTLFFWGGANAACTQADSSGTWHTYSNGTYFSGGYVYLAHSACLAKINTTGYSLAGSTCVGLNNNSTVLTGRILVASNCKVTGSVKIGSVTHTIKEAWMDRSKNSMPGIVTIPNSSFTFQAVRQ
jgi:hypothetical protein